MYFVLVQSQSVTFSEPTWNTSVTVKSNTAIGVMIFTVPGNDGFGERQADIYLCNTSDYFEMVFRNIYLCNTSDYFEMVFRNQCELQARCSSFHTLDTHFSFILIESSTSGTK